MIYSDFINLSQYRQDGRKHDQLRSLVIQSSLSDNIPNMTNEEVIPQSILQSVQDMYDGSSYVKMGLTEVLCFIKGPQSLANSYEGNVININLIQPAFSGSNHKPFTKINKEWNDFSESLRISFEKLILIEHYEKSRIEINITILQHDGSIKSAIFNAISVGLVDAGIEIKDMAIGIQIGYDGQQAVCDLTYEEEKKSEGVLTMSYLPQLNRVDYLDMGMGKVSMEVYSQMQAMGVQMATLLYDIIRQNITQYAIKKILFQQQLQL